MKKGIRIVLALVFGFSFLLAGCGGTDSPYVQPLPTAEPKFQFVPVETTTLLPENREIVKSVKFGWLEGEWFEFGSRGEVLRTFSATNDGVVLVEVVDGMTNFHVFNNKGERVYNTGISYEKYGNLVMFMNVNFYDFSVCTIEVQMQYGRLIMKITPTEQSVLEK